MRELVARAMRGKCVRQGSMAKIGGFAALRGFSYTTRANISHEEAEQIRARIVCTPAESAWRGLTHMRSMCVGVAETGHRGFDTYADGAIKITFILLCSHPDTHPNSNREVRHSLTWHSSESESALERFESVAVVMLQLDGRGALFAPVAARRQKEFKRGKHSSFCPFRSFRTSEKNTIRKVSFNTFHHAKARETQTFFCRFLSRKATLNRLFLISVSVISIYAILICKIGNSQNSPPMI